MQTLPIHINEASGVPFYRQIVDQAAQLIRSGQLAPQTKLPSVRDLAGQLLVSLITTRRAYADLETAGLILRRQGYGTYVAKEIEMATHEQAVNMTRENLEKVVNEARRLGLNDDETMVLFTNLIKNGDHDERS